MTPVWMNLYAPISGTRVSAQNARGWVIDAHGTLFYYDEVNYVWVQVAIPTAASPLVSISSSTDGSVLGITANGNVYLYSYGSWAQVYVTAYAATNASIGDINHFAVVDNNGAVTRSVYTINAAMATGPVKISGTPGLGQVWGVGSTGTVYKWNASTSTWTSVPGKTLVQIHVSLSSSNTLQVFGVDTLGKGWSYDSTTSAWSAIIVPNPGDKYVWIEGGAGYVWGLLTNGTIYRGFI